MCLWIERVDEWLHPDCTTVSLMTENRKYSVIKIALEQFGAGVKHDDKAFFDMQRQLSDMKWLSARNFGFAEFCISSKVKRVSLNSVDKL